MRPCILMESGGRILKDKTQVFDFLFAQQVLISSPSLDSKGGGGSSNQTDNSQGSTQHNRSSSIYAYFCLAFPKFRRRASTLVHYCSVMLCWLRSCLEVKVMSPNDSKLENMKRGKKEIKRDWLFRMSEEEEVQYRKRTSFLDLFLSICLAYLFTSSSFPLQRFSLHFNRVIYI